ncbi:MAG: 3-phosphoshikimate 1-carboxyvinyltransferase, partial [Chloroflexota bacterium]|nr:3-phosphoshikimate 1-carboxyvinyltransferase [Chloroflexota bacterium]
TIRDAGELRVKESDRIAEVARGLIQLGARVDELADGMVIHGGLSRFKGAALDARGDHRLAMAWAVAGLLSETGVRVEGAESAGVSYPSFWQQLGQFQ